MSRGDRCFRFMVTGALLCIVLLVFVGAVVRATGAGLGCPDWPKCWGQLVPPWKVEQVDLDKIDYERFEKKAKRLGRDPESVTPENILKSFNPVHTWTEFINRLFALPVALFSLGAVVSSFFVSRRFPRVRMQMLAGAILFIVLLNAFLGAMVVWSGLKPGMISLHLALAFLLIFVTTYCRRVVSEDEPWEEGRTLRSWIWALLGLVMLEGIMGSQVRELTDSLAKSHLGELRKSWIVELERSVIYLVHRSFSWLIVVLMAVVAWKVGRLGIFEKRAITMTILVGAMMVMGLILAQVSVFPLVQILHVGAAALMVVVLCDWSLVLNQARK